MSYNPGYPPDEDIDDITTDKWGNVYITAQVKNDNIYIGSTTFPSYGSYPYLTQTMITSLRCDGTLRWSKMMAGCVGKAFAIKTDTLGGLYITGYITNSSGNGACRIRSSTVIDTTIAEWPNPIYRPWYLMKLDTGGTFTWIRFPAADTATYFAGSGYAYDMDVDQAGNIFMLTDLKPGAYANGAFTTSHTIGWGADGNLEAYLMKYDRNGNFVSGVHLPYHFNRHSDAPRQWYARDKKRNINILNGIVGHIAGDSLWIEGQQIYTMYVAAFDDAGSLLWLKQQDSAGQGGKIGVCNQRTTIDNNGSIYLAGNCWNGYSFNGTVFHGYFTVAFLLKLDSMGNNLWGRNSWNTSATNAMQAAVSGNTVALFGSNTGPVSWGADTAFRPWNCGYRTFLARFNATTGAPIGLDSVGAPVCGSYVNPSFGGGMVDGSPGCITTDPYGNFYMGGTFDYKVWFGADTMLSHSGDKNFYIAKFGTTNCSIPILSVESAIHKVVKIYPNPATDEVIIERAQPGTSIKMYDIIGKTVRQLISSSDKERIETSGLQPGIYLVELLYTNGERKIEKLLIQ